MMVLTAGSPKSVLLVSFIEDPFDPAGHERFGGGHLFLFDLGRHLVRSGYSVLYLTRRNARQKPVRQRIGSRCEIRRLAVGEPEEIPPHEVAALRTELAEATSQEIRSLAVTPQVVHSHYWISGLVCCQLFQAGVLQTQLHVHSILSLGRIKTERGEDSTPADVIRDEAELRIFQEADELIAVCPNEANDVRRLYPEISATSIRIIPYAIDDELFQQRPESTHSAVRRAYQRFKEGTSDPSPRC